MRVKDGFVANEPLNKIPIFKNVILETEDYIKKPIKSE